MKRFAICALVVMAVAQMASAQATVWVQPTGGGNEICLGISETAVVQLWLTVAAPAGGQLQNIDAILTQYSTVGGAFEVVGFNDQGPWGNFERKGRGLIPPPPDTLNGYQFVGADEITPFTGGLGSGTYLLDEIIIHGIVQTQDAPCPPCDTATADKILFGTGPAAPGGFITYVGYTGYYQITAGTGTGANPKGTASDLPLYVCVTPEPTALSLLILGGLAVFRRR